ncbi:MAG: sigma-54 dependent transcriptional regulator [Acidobacteriota bacterium]
MKPRARILVVDDDDLIVSMLARVLRGDGYEVRTESDPAGVVEAARVFAPDVMLLDIKLPGRSGIELLEEVVAQGLARQVVMLTADDSAETAVKAMKLGAADYLTKPFNLEEVQLVIAAAVEKGRLRREVDYLRRVSQELMQHDFVGTADVILELKEKAATLADAGVGVILITGESGTGKELLARYIHERMHGDEGSNQAPFVGINCAALPETLIESELFGHEKGAFTDAKSEKKGVFELAYGGTILLDEVAEMQLHLQSKLLRVLEERQVRRIGARQTIPFEGTVITTTNRDLTTAVEQGAFRIDLLYRLNAFALQIPPLRERPGDVMLLAHHFLEHFSMRYQRTSLRDFSPEAADLMTAYSWPGNVRELRNVIERIVVLEKGERVLPYNLPKEIARPRVNTVGGTNPGQLPMTLPDGGISLDAVERSLIEQALQRADGNKTQAAKLLDISYDSLRYQIKKLGLE